jgi:hypothetical protein
MTLSCKFTCLPPDLPAAATGASLPPRCIPAGVLSMTSACPRRWMASAWARWAVLRVPAVCGCTALVAARCVPSWPAAEEQHSSEPPAELGQPLGDVSSAALAAAAAISNTPAGWKATQSHGRHKFQPDVDRPTHVTPSSASVCLSWFFAQPTSCMPRMQEFKGYVLKIMGGQDKQGFPMKQGVLTNNRVQASAERALARQHTAPAARPAAWLAARSCVACSFLWQGSGTARRSSLEAEQRVVSAARVGRRSCGGSCSLSSGASQQPGKPTLGSAALLFNTRVGRPFAASPGRSAAVHHASALTLPAAARC